MEGLRILRGEEFGFGLFSFRGFGLRIFFGGSFRCGLGISDLLGFFVCNSRGYRIFFIGEGRR